MLLLSLLVTPFIAAAPLKLAAPVIHVVGVDPSLAEFFSEHLAQQMKLAGAQVITQREMSTMLGLERQKELLGCATDSTSCVAELASALGTDGVVLGDVAKVGSRFAINLKVISSADGRTVSAFSDTVGSEEAVVEALTRGAQALAAQASVQMSRPLVQTLGPSPDHRKLALIPTGAGVVFGAAAAGLFWASDQNYQALVQSVPTSAADGRNRVSIGKLEQNLGTAALVTAAVAVAAAVVALVFGWPSAPVALVDDHPTPAAGYVP